MRINRAWPLFLLACGMTTALGQGQSRSSANQGATPMGEIDMGTPLPAHILFAPPERLDDRIPFIHDARFGAQLRSYYFNQDKFNNTRSEAWTLGGSLAYQSGYLADLLRIGAVAYTSQPLHAPKDRDGTQLLKPGQEGYTVLGQIYGEVRFTDQISGALGRKEYNTPYLNGNDGRMTPNTFEGLSLYGKAGGKDGAAEWRYGGGYVSKIKPRNDDDFVWMSREAGASVNRGVYDAGANFARKDFSVGAIAYHSPDIINISYTEAKSAQPLGGGTELKLGAQYADQRSTGDELLTGKAFSTHQWGLKSDLDIGAALLTVAYTDTASGANMRNPWSGNPGYTDAQVKSFNRAGESATLLRMEYDFSRYGAQGLSAYALRVHGSGVRTPAFNEDELDLNLQWAPKNGALRGMSMRLRYAHVKQRGGGDPDINDIRIILSYDFPAR